MSSNEYVVYFLNQIKTKLETLISLTDDKLKAVYDYPVETPSGSPFAVIKGDGWRASFADTSRNRRTFLYRIFLFQAVGEGATAQQNAVRILRQIQDEVIELFDNDPKLNNTALLVQPIEGTPEEEVEVPSNHISVQVLIGVDKLVIRTQTV